MTLELVIGNIGDELGKFSLDVNEYLRSKASPEEWQNVLEYYDSVNINVKKVLNSPLDELDIVFNDTIEPFAHNMDLFSNILLKIMDGDISKVIDSDKYAYGRATGIIEDNFYEIGNEKTKNIQSIIEKWMDFSIIVSINIVRNLSQLTTALQKISSTELVKSNFGTLLALACIFRILYHKEWNSGKIDMLIKLGMEYSEQLESFADTIDILCNPDEIKLIDSIDHK